MKFFIPNTEGPKGSFFFGKKMGLPQVYIDCHVTPFLAMTGKLDLGDLEKVELDRGLTTKDRNQDGDFAFGIVDG